MTQLQMDPDWERFQNSSYKWRNIRMKEVVYSDLPPGAEDVIRDLVQTWECNGEKMEKVQRLDPQTIELVWYDDIDGDSDKEPTEIDDTYLRNVQKVLAQFFGDHWRVSRKSDQRRWNNEHPQRAVVRRAEAQRFRYNDENNEEYLLMLHGRPEGLPDDVGRWSDYEPYEQPSEAQGLYDSRDVYVYETSTGTRHLVHGQHLRNTHHTSDVKAECGRVVPSNVLVDVDVTHLAAYIDTGDEEEDPHPERLFGDDLCGACWKSYQRAVKGMDGSVRRRHPPSSNYYALADWTLRPEVDR